MSKSISWVMFIGVVLSVVLSAVSILVVIRGGQSRPQAYFSPMLTKAADPELCTELAQAAYDAALEPLDKSAAERYAGSDRASFYVALAAAYDCDTNDVDFSRLKPGVE